MAGIYEVTFELSCSGDGTNFRDTIGVSADNAVGAIAKATKYYEESGTTEDEDGNPLPKPQKFYTDVELLEVKLKATADI